MEPQPGLVPIQARIAVIEMAHPGRAEIFDLPNLTAVRPFSPSPNRRTTHLPVRPTHKKNPHGTSRADSDIHGSAQIRRGQHNLDGRSWARRDLRPTDLSGPSRHVARATFHGCNVQASNMKSSRSRMRDDIRTHELEKATLRDNGGGGGWAARVADAR